MPRAPSYQIGRVAPVEVTPARFRAANNNGGIAGGLAEGLQGAGNALSQFADAQDKLNAQNDDTQARALASSAQLAYSTATTEYELKQGGAARESQAEYTERLAKLREETLAQAGNGRQRRFLAERLDPIHNASLVTIGRHAVKEQQVERAGTLDAEIDSTAEWAAGLTDPAQRDAATAQVSRLAMQRLQEIDGYDPETSPEVFKLAALKATDKVHGAVADRMLGSPDPQVDEILAYVDAYGDEMLASTRNRILKSLQQPLQERIERSDAATVLGLVSPTAQTPTATPGSGTTSAVSLLRDFEGFRETPYWDVNHHRVGYGSDTITTADGKVRAVTPGMRVSRADAERDLARRTGALAETAARKAGNGWSALPAGAQAAVISVAYNYGEGSDRLAPLWAAARRGDAAGVAEVITSFAGDNGGINRQRRMQEAAAALGQGGGAIASAPREWDRSAIEKKLNERAAAEGWSPERTERARKEIDRVISRDEGLLRDQRAEADEQAANIVAQKGEGFTSTNMIPSAVRAKLSPVQLAQYEDIARKNREPKPAAANGAEALALSVMRIENPEQFAGLNLAKYAPYLTPAELEQFAKDQATIRKGGGTVVQDKPKIDATISRMKNWGGVDLGEQPIEALRVRRYMETQADELRSKGKEPAQQDYDRWFNEATQQVTVQHKTLGIVRSRSTRRSSEYLSPNFRAVIRREFRQAFGREPTEADMQAWYEKMAAGAE